MCLWKVDHSQRAWSLWLCFHRIIRYHSLPFTLQVQSHVCDVHTFKRGGWAATEPQPHSTGAQLWDTAGKGRGASSSSQEFCAWSAPFLHGFLNEHGFNCAGTVPINVITLAFAQGLCHIYHEGGCVQAAAFPLTAHTWCSPEFLWKQPNPICLPEVLVSHKTQPPFPTSRDRAAWHSHQSLPRLASPG